MGHPVSLQPLRSASDRAFFRRADPGAVVAGRVSRFRTGRRFLQWAVERAHQDGELRAEFGREPGEPLPSLADMPPEVFEFYTPPGTYFDAFPVHILTTSTLARMEGLNAAARWDVRRFRPNLVIDTDTPSGAPVETAWTGRMLKIGATMLRGEILCPRCAMPTHAQGDLPKDPSVLRTIVREADQCLGLYATVVECGPIMPGDPVEVL